jgi:hypothetical protein
MTTMIDTSKDADSRTRLRLHGHGFFDFDRRRLGRGSTSVEDDGAPVSVGIRPIR